MVWGYARAVDRAGVEIHPFTEVTDIQVDHGTVMGVMTNRGPIRTGTVVNATAGWASTISNMAGVPLPIVTHPLQAFVTEPLKPWLNTVIVSGTLHVYINQTGRGSSSSGRSSITIPLTACGRPLISWSSRQRIPLSCFPFLREVRVLRQWAGICDMTPDFSPIIGPVDELKGYYLDVGWGTYGFKVAPIAGKTTAECIATGRVPDLIAPFAYSRFEEDTLVGERAAAATSH